ncbi:SIMPL domain-containing protein [Mucilaginibacter ximonensis]|uniref:SIMPL domain-containing protein n=1 Tax=Mucilaginibacter ximonensis TaxID=538021 RepID=A0ABW5YBM4_9SPHI
MKKLLIIAALTIATTYTTFAQSVDLRRKIEVTGIAEQEVTPDIINVSISLQEYGKVTIDQLEKQLEDAVQAAGIPKEDFTVNNLSSYNYKYQKKKDPAFMASKQYGIRFHNLNKFDQIIAKIDPKGIQSTNIDSYDYSKIEDLKNELKLKALMSAKSKATYLLTGLNENLGPVLNITENDNSVYAQPRAIMFKTAAMSADRAVPESDIDFKKIKLSFQINAVFQIGK